jgi:hypothetical protein
MGTVVDKEDFHFTYYDRKTIKFAIYADNTFDKFLINTDDVYSYSREHHYSINDTTVYSGTWFSEDAYSGELVASEGNPNGYPPNCFLYTAANWWRPKRSNYLKEKRM